MAYSKQEQETTIIMDESEKIAHVYTASPVMMRRLDKMCDEFPDDYVCTWREMTDGRATAARYECGKKYVKFRRPRSETQKAADVERGLRMRTAIDGGEDVHE